MLIRDTKKFPVLTENTRFFNYPGTPNLSGSLLFLCPFDFYFRKQPFH